MGKKQQQSTKSPPAKSLPPCMQNFTCCVNTKNDDGMYEHLCLIVCIFYNDCGWLIDRDVSDIITDLLRGMGAEVSSLLSEAQSHLIWQNGCPRRLIAAFALGLTVVSPLWAEQCHDSKALVSPDDFLVPSPFAPSVSTYLLSPGATIPTHSLGGAALDGALLLNKKDTHVPQNSKSLHHMRSIDSPFFSSSQRIEEQKNHAAAEEGSPSSVGSPKIQSKAVTKGKKPPCKHPITTPLKAKKGTSPKNKPIFPVLIELTSEEAELYKKVKEEEIAWQAKYTGRHLGGEIPTPKVRTSLYIICITALYYVVVRSL